MRHYLMPLACGLSLSWMGGCGGAAPTAGASAPALKAAHGGLVLPLPEGKGYVELVNADVKTPARGGPSTSTIVAYFIKPDGTPMDPPSGATFALDPSLGGKTVSLNPAPAGDARHAGALVSPPGDYGREGLIGELSATVDGAPVKASIAGR